MAGTLRGRIEALIAEATEQLQAGVVFKNIYDVLDAHPQTTLISLGYGTGGSGTDYPDGPNPFGNNAHFVFRFDTHAGRSWPFYLFGSVGGITSTTAISNVQPNGSFASSGNGQVVLSAAVGIGGTGNPYNGTQNADGTDTKPTQLWANPSGGTNVQVVPASNSGSGADGTNKNNCLLVYNEATSGNNVRYHIVCDDDNIVCCWSEGDDGSYGVTWFGALTPNPALASYPSPLACYTQSQIVEITLTGSAYSADVSGVTTPDTSITTWQSSSVLMLGPDRIFASPYLPNTAEGVFDAFSLGIAAAEPSVAGYRGETSFLLTTWGVAAQDTDTAQTLFCAGPSGATNNKTVIPWDGATTPGSGTARTGTDFTRVP